MGSYFEKSIEVFLRLTHLLSSASQAFLYPGNAERCACTPRRQSLGLTWQLPKSSLDSSLMRLAGPTTSFVPTSTMVPSAYNIPPLITTTTVEH
ncbi:hypothetical protein AMTR_s00007p00220170 [Amborella trichopoda]|uniref:Uncharacterized protein n=1 Tax=Amborella trichopoda TaxID=13333 RepID=W1P693_AMBTC|nr:hypothetical protein AMTR_s00007p00220170 [Amborella trichopoda]